MFGTVPGPRRSASATRVREWRAAEQQADAVARRATRHGPFAGSGFPAPGPALPSWLASSLADEARYDFSKVRVHADSQSGAMARSAGAAGFTRGADVYLGDAPVGGHSTTRILAHEAVHAAQQGAIPALPGPSAGVPPLPSRAGVTQFTPGVDAEDSWREVASEAFVPNDPPIRARGIEARRRLLQTREGQRLVNSLWHLSRDRARRPRFGIDVAFRTELPPEWAAVDNPAGYFEPELPDARRYSIGIKDRPPREPGAVAGTRVISNFTDPESEMAETLDHELEHVEFVRTTGTEPGVRYRTGHGPLGVERQGDPVFRERVDAFATDLKPVEARIHEEAERQRQPASAPPQPLNEPVLEPRSRGTSRSNGPPFLGLRLSGEAGVASQGGAARFGGVVGADLILGRLHSLNLGVRGVYLTPDRLLAGGTVGFRAVQTGDGGPGRTVENPLFFDLEAGVVGQLNSNESSRIMDRVALFGSAGIGQEYGTSGSRFFWRLGGYVIVTDRQQTAGGGSFGVGVHFQ
ncbi:MAG TPA: DUF4157 domain-containing protein [Dehalococcoidia bacterium]|nr:DUF4157 domain-containing protein [Dehalococcoidia bacterium]